MKTYTAIRGDRPLNDINTHVVKCDQTGEYVNADYMAKEDAELLARLMNAKSAPIELTLVQKIAVTIFNIGMLLIASAFGNLNLYELAGTEIALGVLTLVAWIYKKTN